MIATSSKQGEYGCGKCASCGKYISNYPRLYFSWSFANKNYTGNIWFHRKCAKSIMVEIWKDIEVMSQMTTDISRRKNGRPMLNGNKLVQVLDENTK